MQDINEITGQIVDVAVGIHSKLGPGLFESVYELLMTRELSTRGLSVERQKVVPIEIDGVTFDEAFRADLLVNRRVVVEIKCVDKLVLVHQMQLFTYMKLLDYRVGLLLNFNTPLMKDGIKRLVNKL